MIRPTPFRPHAVTDEEGAELADANEPEAATTPDRIAHVVHTPVGFEVFPTEGAALASARRTAEANIGALITVFRATTEIRAVLDLQERQL